MVIMMLSLFSITGVTQAQTKANTAVHLKKNGTPDKRFKENKTVPSVHVKKDGTADKRYKENKPKS